jgi:hypothetical protein
MVELQGAYPGRNSYNSIFAIGYAFLCRVAQITIPDRAFVVSLSDLDTNIYLQKLTSST